MKPIIQLSQNKEYKSWIKTQETIFERSFESISQCKPNIIGILLKLGA